MRVLALLLLVLPATAAAHSLEPSLLELSAAEDGHIDVVWTTPARRVPGVVMQVVLPPGCRPVTEPAVTQDTERVVTRWTADCPGGLVGERVSVTDLAAGRTEVLLRIRPHDGRLVQTVLTGDEPELVVPAAPRTLDVVGAYVRLGVHHILAGVDHLLFVIGLLLLVAGRSLLPAITAFTLGHSVTLTLAVLGLVRVPQQLAEVLIAASVFVLAVELARPQEEPRSVLARRPWLTAFAFGLLHGFGFAGALAEIGLPEGDIPLALGSFNVGIELGQIAVVLAALAVARAGRGLVAGRGRWQQLVSAYAIGTLAFFWVLDRAATLFG